MSPNSYQTEHDLLREALRRFLIAKVQSPRGAAGFDQMVCGAVRRWIRCLLLIR